MIKTNLINQIEIDKTMTNKTVINESVIKQKTTQVLRPVLLSLSLVAMSANMTGCGYNKLQTQDEAINSNWSEVVNQYQRRADLVPNLVEAVKKHAENEKEVFTAVADARSKVGSIQLTPETLNNPQALENFSKAQAQMQGALSRLMAVSENYPDLKSDALFLDFQAQLEGTENRIAVARRRYIKSIEEYNSTVRKFPSNVTAKMFGMDTKLQFTVENEAAIKTAPKVSFDD